MLSCCGDSDREAGVLGAASVRVSRVTWNQCSAAWQTGRSWITWLQLELCLERFSWRYFFYERSKADRNV